MSDSSEDAGDEGDIHDDEELDHHLHDEDEDSEGGHLQNAFA